MGLVLAPLMHGAAQWGTLGGLIRGTHHRAAPAVRRRTRCGRPSSSYRIATLAITGDAMARPLIEALQRAATYDTSSLVVISSTAAVFSPVVKDQLFELLPNLFISEAVGSSESGFNGMRLVEKGDTANATGLDQREHAGPTRS